MPQTVDAGDSVHVCHGKGVKKYEVQSVKGMRAVYGSSMWLA